MMLLKPVFGSEKNVKLIRRRVIIGENPASKSGYKFENQVDYPASLLAFKALVEGLPQTKGILILSGVTSKGTLEFIKIIKGEFSLQQAVKQGSSKRRFDEFVSLMSEKNYRYLQVQLATAS